MRRSLTALTLASLLLPLGGCDIVRGLFGLGFIVSGQVTFSSSARTMSGDLYIRLLSTVEADHTGTVVQERRSVYNWGDLQESFRFTGVQEGPCHVLAFIDANANRAWDPGEPVGGYSHERRQRARARRCDGRQGVRLHGVDERRSCCRHPCQHRLQSP